MGGGCLRDPSEEFEIRLFQGVEGGHGVAGFRFEGGGDELAGGRISDEENEAVENDTTDDERGGGHELLRDVPSFGGDDISDETDEGDEAELVDRHPADAPGEEYPGRDGVGLVEAGAGVPYEVDGERQIGEGGEYEASTGPEQEPLRGRSIWFVRQAKLQGRVRHSGASLS